MSVVEVMVAVVVVEDWGFFMVCGKLTCVGG